MKKSLALVMTIILLAFSIVGCTSKATSNTKANNTTEDTSSNDKEEKKVKVALLLPGNINDAGWNAAAYDGLMDAKAKFNLDTAYTESVPLAEQESTIRDYASRGYNLIICHGNDFDDAVKNVASEFPKTYFAVSNSTVKLDNVVGMNVMNEEQGYLAGYALGLITKANKVGFIGSNEMLPVKRTEAGFKKGVSDANPKVEVVVAYTGSGDDAAKGKETALAIFDKGVDGVFQYAQGSGIGVIQAAAEKNKMVVVTSPNQVKIASKMSALAVMSDMKVNIVAAVSAYINNEFNANLNIVGSFKSGLYKVSDINNELINSEQLKKITDQIEKLKKGEIVFDSSKK